MLRIGCKGAWCRGITSASHAEGPGLNPQRVQFDRQRCVKSCVESSAKAWLRLAHINVVGQLGGCNASERPVLKIEFKGAWCSGITSASHAEGVNPQCVQLISNTL